MQVRSVSARDFRSYDRLETELGSSLTVLTGENGAGKTNLLEAVYFGCTGRSCRTHHDAELHRFGTATLRVSVAVIAPDGRHELAVGLTRGEAKRMWVDTAPVERLLDTPHRPLVSVFLPDRLDLIKGVPAGRRAHLDQLLGALWPSRAQTRRAYAQILTQRNALVARLRGVAPARWPDHLEAWDTQLVRAGLALMADRAAAAAAVAPHFGRIAAALGLEDAPTVSYRPRVATDSEDVFLNELRARWERDVERGHTGYGPHRDDLVLRRADHDLRTYGSQGQQRLGLLALLLAERAVLAEQRDRAPLMLLDDVMSELDRTRRRRLVDLLLSTPGQALITATDSEHVPVPRAAAAVQLVVAGGALTGAPPDGGDRADC